MILPPLPVPVRSQAPTGATTEIVPIGEIPLANAVARIERVRKDGIVVPPPTTGVTLLKVRYPSVGVNGTPETLSGLLMLPANGDPRGLVVECHGTILSRASSPSRYRGGVIDPKSKEPKTTHPEEEAVALAFAAGGYAVAMPDYPGLGDDPGVHPYPLSRLNATSTVDLISAVREARPETRGPLYVTGYSEGGSTAMWTVRKLEAAGVPVAAAAPMSGPYDLSGVTMRSFLRSGQRLQGLGEKIFLLSFTAYSTKVRRPDLDLRDYFVPSMATYIPYLYDPARNLPVEEIAKRLVIKTFQLGARESVVRVLTPSFRKSIETHDLSDPFLREFAEEDTSDWTPRTKMLLPYLGNDGVVVPENTTVTLDAMRARGIGLDLVRAYEIAPQRGRNHITAAGPALAAVRRFFDGGFAAFGDELAPGVVKATVRARDRGAIAAGETITLRLLDRTDPKRSLLVAEVTGTATAGTTTTGTAATGDVPVAFRLEYERARVLPAGRYVLRAEVVTNGVPAFEAERGFDERATGTLDLRLGRTRR